MVSVQSGYYRFPTICGDRAVFVCEDDLWSVPVSGGVAVRLTANLGEVSRPFLSPNGQQLAFVGREEGHMEVYCMPAQGGVAKRLTFLGANTMVVGWNPAGDSIVFASNARQPFRHIFKLHSIHPEGGMPEELPYGLAHTVSFGTEGGVVLGRNTTDPARWKRYRGGTAGVIWIDPEGSGNFRRLIDLNGNLAAPMWVGDRIYFISDHEGVGNLYSCTPAGDDLQPVTHNTEYYVRNATTDGRRIIYHAGGDLFYLEPSVEPGQVEPGQAESGQAEPRQINVEFHSPRVQRQRKFVDAGDYLEDYTLHPDGHSTLINTRGKSFYFGNWEGSVIELTHPDYGQAPEGRYRLTRWLNDKQRLVTISDRGGVEALEIHSSELGVAVEQLTGLDLGRAVELEVSPTADQVVLSNHRNELIWVNLETRQSRVLDRSDYFKIQGFDWSPDGQWVAYSCAETQLTFSIKICQISSGEVHCLTPPRFRDLAPSFDPDGKFLYFLSLREFNPIYDSIYFDLGFPKGMRPFLISLQKDTPSPFIPVPKPLSDKSSEKSEEKSGTDEESEPNVDEITPIEIDFDGIERRIIGFPVPEGIYQQVWGIKGKVLFSSVPIQGSLDQNWSSPEPEAIATIEMYDFEDYKQEKVATEVTDFAVAKDNETLIYRSKNRLRVCKIAPMDEDGPPDDKPGRQSGWLDLDRVRVSIEPPQEWQQMFREVWRLQKEHFWTEDMSGVDWDRVYDRYLPLLDRVTTRSEFSDLVWEMQGELGTSHAYEIGGDYREEPGYHLGFLGADFAYDEAADAYRIQHIVQGDSWTDKDSPLNQIGVNIREGDLLLAVGNRRLSRHVSPQELLVHQAGCEINLTVGDRDTGNPRTVTVKTLSHESPTRYREWVERNHRQVGEATQGRVGYVHVPDMGPEGYAEFHRYYFAEVHKEALIVDVRYNGGGHVSQLILEKLARKRVGYDVPRWGKPEPYPSDSLIGPVVALTNEYAGSDGDIFSHCFKLMQVGMLIGKRTWGGVVGIWPQHPLSDLSIVTQPEYSFWFVDVGWGVENYGTDPDIEVDITPQEWANHEDPQLDRAIKVVLEQLERFPPRLPDFGDRPRLTLPG